ncbi:Rv3212 family protein [Corynebacterium uterequi]|uniref:Secreted protein n=1 Tax=Corynebacterium uterequi TaxID=1072256 RepID=A0A0G3HAZ0_9CORY|nr:hypothetical protein [Corynebacterium uterequi]AKK10541.1 hypothetical protein CUTER_02630 [Corynebacterium uterequi]
MSPRAVPVLRRTRGDVAAAAALTLVAITAVATAWLSAPVRDVAHSPASTTPPPLAASAARDATLPDNLTELYTAPAAELEGVYRPVVAQGLIISHDRHAVRALAPDGKQVWSYARSDREICSLGEAWTDVVVTFRGPAGCGDVVSLDALTGQYSATRSAVAPDTVAAVRSNDRVGTVSEQRVELWRSDLVRTVEYGDVEAPQEPEMQPHASCRITSALTRTELLAVTEVCPDAPEQTQLRLQDVTPEDSRKPEIHVSIPLPSPDATLVAVGEKAAAVYLPHDGAAEIVSYDLAGAELARSAAADAPLLSDPARALAPATADLPHHMTWFDGSRLYLFDPVTLRTSLVVEDVLGTGAPAGDGHVVVPTATGLSVVDTVSGEVTDAATVPRPSSGEVYVAIAADVLVERRGGELVVLGTPR